MRFLVDAQLPRRMVAWLNNAGCDAVHTLDLPDRNRSTDDQIIEFAEQEQRIVVSKDAELRQLASAVCPASEIVAGLDGEH